MEDVGPNVREQYIQYGQTKKGLWTTFLNNKIKAKKGNEIKAKRGTKVRK
jgi:hypothetical protein